MGEDEFGKTIVLVVENEIELQEILPLLQKIEGVTIIVVDSCEEAFSILKQFQPDAIVCNANFSDEDGHLFIEKWRSSEMEIGLSAIPAIAIYEMLPPDSKQANEADGFQACLFKPLTLEQVLKVVELVPVSNSA